MWEQWAKAGFVLNVKKTKVLAQSPALALRDWSEKRVPTLRCLGADLVDDGIAWERPGQGGALRDELRRSADKLKAYAARLRELQDAGLSIQLSQSLLRYCAVGSPQHVLMCKMVTPAQVAEYDVAVRDAWQLSRRAGD